MRHNTLCKKWLPSGNNIDERNGQLDSLRALSVTGVLIDHFWPTRILDFVDLGHIGVCLFFVLSGYLITGILLRFRSSIEGGRSDVATALRRFYIRRFLRIFPPYYALLTLMVVTKFPDVRNTLWWHAGYASNFLFALQGSWTPWVTSHFWSLSVEEQFYLVWPFLILLIPRSRLVAVVIAIIVSSPLFRLIALLAGTNDVTLYVATPASLDALGPGIAAGALRGSAGRLAPPDQTWAYLGSAHP